MDEKLFADVDVYINSLFASEDPAVREGKVLDPSSDDPAVQGVRRLNQALATDPRVSATILANVGLKKYDGMAIALVRGYPTPAQSQHADPPHSNAILTLF